MTFYIVMGLAFFALFLWLFRSRIAADPACFITFCVLIGVFWPIFATGLVVGLAWEIGRVFLTHMRTRS